MIPVADPGAAGSVRLGSTQHLRQQLHALKSERASWDAHWREIAELMSPRLSRFNVTDANDGKKKHGKVNDNSAIFAARTLAAGMMSGITSPARPWFALTIKDRDLAESGDVKRWLHEVTKKLRMVMAASNTYNSLHAAYRELGLFGTWADIVVPNYENVIHHYPLTIGQYSLATDEFGKVNTLARELRMSVEQCVRMFGLDNVSQAVRSLYNAGQYTPWVVVYHLIVPRRERDTRKADAKNMPFRSVWIEAARDDGDDKPLRDSGFKRFRALCPRWDVVGEDVYGCSPAMDALGDTKYLQFQQVRKAQAIDYQVAPPLQVPTQYKDQAANRMPGGVMYVDQVGAGGGVRSAFEVNLRLNELLLDIQDVRSRINKAFYADLFLMLASQPANSRMTATEVAERHEEKLLMLGPVLERLHNEMLSPLIDIAFDQLAEAGALPPIPPEMRDVVDLEVEFVSILAQAQRMVATSGTERLLTSTMALANAHPDVLDKIDFDQVVDDFAEAYGVNPAIVVPDDEVQRRRAQRAAQMAQAQAAANAPQTVESAKTASEIDVANLRDVMGSLQGYNTPSPAFVE